MSAFASPETPPSDELPVWLAFWGMVALPGAAYLSFRLAWEQTFLSWKRGPQMVGFSLAHTGPFFELLLSYVCLLVWLAIVLALTVWRMARGAKVSWVRWASVAGVAFVLILGAVPYAAWMRLFAGKIARGPFAAEFAAHAAASGYRGVVAALVDRGLPVDARTSDGQTSLHAAAVAGKVDVLRDLIARGADVNAVNDSGDSPLEEAESLHHADAAALLRAHGAIGLRGDDERRKAAIEARVGRDIEAMERASREKPGSRSK
jgi:Ankyrin repeats (many copies)